MTDDRSDRDVLDAIQASLDGAERKVAEAKKVLDRERQARRLWNGILVLLVVASLANGWLVHQNSARIERQAHDAQQILCEASNRIGRFAVRADIEAGEALIEAAELPESDEEAAAQQKIVEAYRQALQFRLDNLLVAFQLDCQEFAQEGEGP